MLKKYKGLNLRLAHLISYLKLHMLLTMPVKILIYFIYRKPRFTQVKQEFEKIQSQIEQERKKERRKETMVRAKNSKKLL